LSDNFLIIDSGTSFSYIDKELFKMVYNNITKNSECFEMYDLYYCLCDSNIMNNIDDIKFTINTSDVIFSKYNWLEEVYTG